MKHFLGVLLKVAISVGLVALFFYQVNWQDILSTAQTAQGEFLFLAVCMFILSNLLGAVQWQALLQLQEIVLPFRQVVTLYFVGVFFNNFQSSFFSNSSFNK